jgi:hypothetical protein
MAPFMVVFSYIFRVILWNFTEDDVEIYKSIYSTREFWLRHKPARRAHPSFYAYLASPTKLCARPRSLQLYLEKHPENKNVIHGLESNPGSQR